jgi:membrane protein DedA with SNARE-associated domain
VVLSTAASFTGAAFSPKLLVENPLLLVALNPAVQNLVLASPSLDAAPFLIVAMVRLFLPDPFYFLIGQGFGDDAIHWVERRSGRAARIVRWAERLFERSGPLVLFVAPVALISVLAGAAHMPFKRFALINLAGTLTGVVLIRWFGARMAGPIDAVRTFVQANVALLTLISIVLVVTSLIARALRARRR